MILLPAIDLYGGKVVRLTKGDYAQMTVYRDDPVVQATDFQAAGAKWLHTVDLEGAKDGTTPNFPVIREICRRTSLKVEVGGGIRNLDTIQKYLDAGVARVILGTAAVTDPALLKNALDRFGAQAAVGVDLKDGGIAIRGWKETAPERAEDFFTPLRNMTVIPDVSVIATSPVRDARVMLIFLSVSFSIICTSFRCKDSVPKAQIRGNSVACSATKNGKFSSFSGKILYKSVKLLGENLILSSY